MNQSNAEQLFQQAQQLKDNGQTQQAIDTFHQAYQQYQQSNDQLGQANCQQMIGVSYTIEANYQAAFDALHQVETIFKALNHQVGLGNVYRDIGLVYLHQQDYQSSLKWMNQSSNILSQTDDQVALGITLAKSALVFLHNKQIDKSKLLFKQSLTLIREQGSWFNEMTVLLDWAQLNYQQKDYHQMITKLWACIGIISEHKAGDSQYRRLFQIYGLLAQGYLNLQNINLSVQLFNKSYQFLSSLPQASRPPVIDSIMPNKFLKTLREKNQSQYQQLVNKIDITILEKISEVNK